MENNLNEAPASATVKIKSKNGFEYLFTLREMNGTTLLDKMEKLEITLSSKGYVPSVQTFSKFPPKAEVPTKPCPTHSGAIMKEKERNGQKFYSHSRGVYPDLEWCNGQGFPSDEI